MKSSKTSKTPQAAKPARKARASGTAGQPPGMTTLGGRTEATPRKARQGQGQGEGSPVNPHPIQRYEADGYMVLVLNKNSHALLGPQLVAQLADDLRRHVMNLVTFDAVNLISFTDMPLFVLRPEHADTAE